MKLKKKVHGLFGAGSHEFLKATCSVVVGGVLVAVMLMPAVYSLAHKSEYM